MVDYNDPTNYVRRKKKVYDVYVCRPMNGTIVVNSLEQADTVEQLGGRTHFTVEDRKKLETEEPLVANLLENAIKDGKCYVIDDSHSFVIAGTLGEMWAVNAETLCKKYRMAGSEEETTPEVLKNLVTNGVMPWQRMTTKPDDSVAWACFVGENQKGQIKTAWGATLNVNGSGVEHGPGDFVLAQNKNGEPNLEDRWVVNGKVFMTTYECQDWINYLGKNVTITQPAIGDLPNLTTSLASKSSNVIEESHTF